MKRTRLCVLFPILLVILEGMVMGQQTYSKPRVTFSSSMNARCELSVGTFIVPPGFFAACFRARTYNSGLPCAGTSPPALGYTVAGPGGSYSYNEAWGGTTFAEAPVALSALTLGSGQYTVRFGGGKDSWVEGSYILQTTPGITGGVRLTVYGSGGRKLGPSDGVRIATTPAITFSFQDMPQAFAKQTFYQGNIPIGTYSITVSAPGYQPETEIVDTISCTDLVVDVSLRPGGVPPVVPTARGIIKGVVEDSTTGWPIQGAVVSTSKTSAITDGNGKYVLTDVPSGMMDVTVSSPAFQQVVKTIEVLAGQTPNVNFSLQPAVATPPPSSGTGTVEGFIEDRETGAPLGGVEVSAGGVTATTSRYGRYKLDGMVAGAVTVAVSLRGYQTDARDVQVRAHQREYLDFSLKSLGGTTPPGSTAPGALPSMAADLMLSFDFKRAPSGATVEDLSGNGNHGIIRGARWMGEKGFYFDGHDDYIEVPHSASLHSDKGLTVVGVMIPWSNQTKAFRAIFWKGNSPDCTRGCENREYTLFLNTEGAPTAGLTPADRVGVGQLDFGMPAPIASAQMVFAMVIDKENGQFRMYANGQNIATRPFSTAGLRATTGALTLAGAPANPTDMYFHGTMKSFRLYSRALSEPEIADLTRELGASRPKRFTTADIYTPDGVIGHGVWASIYHMREEQIFSKYDWRNLKRGFSIQDGLYTSPSLRGPTEAVYLHDGSPTTLSGYAGILDCLHYCGTKGSVEFLVKGDGRILWQSGLVLQNDPARPFSVSLAGVQDVRLVVTNGNNNVDEDWGAWLNLRFGGLPVNLPGGIPYQKR